MVRCRPPVGESLEKAVVLAAGRGTRMRAPAPAVRLEDAQQRMADLGLKPLLPFHGHAYIEYVLSAIADAGFREACLVVGPGEDPIREHLDSLPTSRLRLRFATQPEPRGGADALVRAEVFAAGEPVAVLNADNHYPVAALERLRALEGPGLVAFRREALVARSNIPEERIGSFALLMVDENGFLERIVEKPGPEEVARLGADPLVSMTCWRFGPAIFDACRDVAPSPRGELELPNAVTLSMGRGARFRVAVSEDPVLDLGTRADVPTVEAALRGVGVEL